MKILDFPLLSLLPVGVVEAANKTGLIHKIGAWLDANQGALHGFSFLMAGLASLTIWLVQTRRLLKPKVGNEDSEPIDQE